MTDYPGFRSAVEILSRETRPEELLRRIRALEQHVEQHQRWLQSHEAHLRAVSAALSPEGEE